MGFRLVWDMRPQLSSTRFSVMTSSTIATPQSAVPPETPPEITYDPRRWWALAAVLCATLLGVLDFLIVNIAVPSIKSDLGATDADIQLTVAGYGLAYAVCLITGGRLGDIFGRKKMFMIGMTGFTLASMLCGLAQTPQQLIAFRVLQGFLASAMSPQVLSIIQVSFSAAEKGLAFAILGAIVGVGSFIGNVFGGWLVDADLFHLGWRPIFFVNVPIGICALIAAWFLVRESKAPNATSLDWGGVLMSGVGLFLLIFPLAEGREKGWPWWAFVCIALSFVLLFAFTRFERQIKARGGTPLLDMSLFQDRAFFSGLGAILALFGGMPSFALAMTLFLQSGLGLSAAQTGIVFAPLPVAFLIGSLSAVHLAKRWGTNVLLLGLGVMLLGQTLMIVWVQMHKGDLNGFSLMPLMFIYGLGQGTTVPRLTGPILTNVARENAGGASGVLTTTQQVAAAVGVSILSSVFFTILGTAKAPDILHYTHAFTVVLCCNLALIGLTFAQIVRLTRIVPRTQKIALEHVAVEA